MSEKPHNGQIANWLRAYRNSMVHRVDETSEYGVNKGYDIIGLFIDHPDFGTAMGRTSLVLTHDEDTGEIETLNSRYTLLGIEHGPEKT